MVYYLQMQSIDIESGCIQTIDIDGWVIYTINILCDKNLTIDIKNGSGKPTMKDLISAYGNSEAIELVAGFTGK